MKLGDKTILMSGAAGALGVSICDHLAAMGARVVATDIVPDALGRFSADPHLLTYLSCDVTKEAEVDSVFTEAIARVGVPNVVCCHAGMVEVQPVQDYPLERFDALLDLNIRGAFILAQRASREWISRGVPGQIIFTTSWVHKVPWPEITPYAASKAALNALMRGFAKELAPHGIRANCLAPGIVGAGMALKAWNENEAYRRRADAAIPLGYLQPVESVANAMAFLCSDMSSYMTGSVLTIDGGCTLYPSL